MQGKITALFFSFILLCGSAAAARLADTDIPERIRLSGTDSELLLNGSGIREKFFVDIYIGALYLPETTTDARTILTDSRPASVHMHFLYREVSRKKIIEGWVEGLSANLSPAEFTALQPRLEPFNNLFSTVHRGDVIRIDYHPGTGTEVRINNERRGVITGNDFFRALLKIWLGDKPVSESLKQGMLGKS